MICELIIENTDWALKSWYEMLALQHRQRRSMPRGDGSLNRIKHSADKCKGIDLSQPIWNGVHGLLGLMELAIKQLHLIHAFVPCFPQRPLPLAVTLKHKKGKICVSAICASGEVTFFFSLILFLEVIPLIIQTAQNQTSSKDLLQTQS